MKKLIIITFIALLVSLTGCTEQIENDTSFFFTHNDLKIKMNAEAEPILEALGEPKEFFEQPSCAYQGMDKFYYFGGFEINTYQKDDIDFILYLGVLDDSVSTPEGVTIGSSFEDMKKAYGEDYSQKNNFYAYTSGQTKLQFIVEDGVITGINYNAIVE